MAPKSLCLTTAFTPVPRFLGGSCPLGCSLSAPATGGFSVVSPQCIHVCGRLRGACALQRHWLRSHASSEGLAPWVVPSALLPQGDSLWLAPSAHVCGRLRGGEAGRLPTSWDIIAHLFVFCKGVLAAAGPGRRVPCCGLRPPSAEGPAWRAPLSHLLHPPTFLEYRGTTPVPPAGAAPPAPRLGDGGGSVFSPGASGCFLARGRGIGTPFLTFPRVRGQGQRRPRGAWERGMGPLRSAI